MEYTKIFVCRFIKVSPSLHLFLRFVCCDLNANTLTANRINDTILAETNVPPERFSPLSAAQTDVFMEE